MEHSSHLFGERRLICVFGHGKFNPVRNFLENRRERRAEGSEPQNENLPEKKPKTDPKIEEQKRVREADEKTKSLKKRTEIKKEVEAKTTVTKLTQEQVERDAAVDTGVRLTQEEVEEAAAVDAMPQENGDADAARAAEGLYKDLVKQSNDAYRDFKKKQADGTVSALDVERTEQAILTELTALQYNNMTSPDPKRIPNLERGLENVRATKVGLEGKAAEVAALRTEKAEAIAAREEGDTRAAELRAVTDEVMVKADNAIEQNIPSNIKVYGRQAMDAILAELMLMHMSGTRAKPGEDSKNERELEIEPAFKRYEAALQKLGDGEKLAAENEARAKELKLATDAAMQKADATIEKGNSLNIKIDARPAIDAILAEITHMHLSGASRGSERENALKTSLARYEAALQKLADGERVVAENEARYRELQEATDEALSGEDRAAAIAAIRVEMAELEERGPAGTGSIRYGEIADKLDVLMRELQEAAAVPEPEIVPKVEVEPEPVRIASPEERADAIERELPGYKALGYIAAALDPKVAEELGLSDDVKKQLSQFSGKRGNELLGLVLETRGLPAAERAKLHSTFQAASEKEGLKLLTDDQRAKLFMLYSERLP